MAEGERRLASVLDSRPSAVWPERPEPEGPPAWLRKVRASSRMSGLAIWAKAALEVRPSVAVQKNK